MPGQKVKLEREIKLQFDVSDVPLVQEVLKEDLKVEREVLQTSFFFDTAEGHFTKEGISIRLRSSEEVECVGRLWEVTVKGKGHREGAAFVKPEEETVVDEATARHILGTSGNGILGYIDQDSALWHTCNGVMDAIPACQRKFHLIDTYVNRRTKIGPLLVADVPKAPAADPSAQLFFELDLTTFEYKGQTRTEAEVECEVPDSSILPSVESYLVSKLSRAADKGSHTAPRPALGKRTRMHLFKVKVDSQASKL
eukprot:Rhum_TRINITY_DN4229_c0_g1::Rhum_TRINITY_DN4229_c0_g1_i1::g.13581::m.13581